MNVTCRHCHAFHWLDERVKNSALSRPEYSRCCHHGKVSLGLLPLPPEKLRTLFTTEHSAGKQFREHIRQYNSALAFTSFTAKELHDNVNAGGGGPWVWKTGYTIYHRVGSLFPTDPRNPLYAQLYFYDALDALDYRMRRNSGLDQQTMQDLQGLLRECNRYTQVFFHANEILERTPSQELGILIVADPMPQPLECLFSQHKYVRPCNRKDRLLWKSKIH
jgi:hypothetical protein